MFWNMLEYILQNMDVVLLFFRVVMYGSYTIFVHLCEEKGKLPFSYAHCLGSAGNVTHRIGGYIVLIEDANSTKATSKDMGKDIISASE